MTERNPLDLSEPASALWADRLKAFEHALLAMIVVIFGAVATIAVVRCVWPGDCA